MDRLQQVIERGNEDELYRLIEQEADLFDRTFEDPVANTPLHDAADKGQTQVAMEMAILKPSFAQKLNRGGHSPMHLALRKKHYRTARALMTLNPELIRVRGQGGITPLHYVAGEKGDNEEEVQALLELLAEFLCACKSSIEDLTSQCETAVHVAVKNHNLRAFKVLLGWLKRVYPREILNWKDQDGNTVLHIAVLERQPEIIKLLIGHVKVNAKNFQGETVLEIFQANPSGDPGLAKSLRLGCLAGLFSRNLPLSQLLSVEPTLFEKFKFQFGYQDESARDIILLVATLVATATYQVGLTPPGGYWGDNTPDPAANSTVATANSSGVAVENPHQAGNIILNGSKLYQFMALNSTVFLVSILTIWITAVPLLPQTLPVYVLASLAGYSFFSTTVIEFPKSDRTTGDLIVNFCMVLLGLVLVLPLCWHISYRLLTGGTDAARRRVGNLLELKDRK
ncbi:ankyrin repeat-containing protein BDA1-like [Rhodamnia argentea]|uniref:Ankyrin repeat-containing protein BDA1-like n=1 Tax=Rhodamnia argentea TaxID=178133 RepID=A0A8B8NX55_9MYRT|nr:ankyrin repeat-containing protein BDA1-like [Rhodamnia argentea]